MSQIHVYRLAADAYEVWLDADAQRDGVCVGCGHTEEGAVAAALGEVRRAIIELEQFRCDGPKRLVITV